MFMSNMITGRPMCHSCHREHDDRHATLCARCRPDRLAAFLRAGRVTIPAGDPDRPVRRVEPEAGR